MVTIGIIGLGPWGLCALERLVDASRSTPFREVDVHIVEPGCPGGGMYSDIGPDYLVLNTPCGQHSLYPFPDLLEQEQRGRGFYDWVSAEGYRWYGTECRRSAPDNPGTPISPHDFLPRRLMGEYLEWFYNVLVREAPANVKVFHHRARAIDVEPLAGGQERIHLERHDSLTVDHVIITTGLEAPRAAPPRGVVSPYPVERYVATASPEKRVAIEGMGLVALDVITALTIGLGGRYTTQPDGRLVYRRSGREPSLYLFSRGGYPYCGKSFAAADPVGDDEPLICTAEAVARLQQPDDAGPKRQINAREELLPLVFAEMELCYYANAARRSNGAAQTEQVKARLVDAWARGTFARERELLAQHYGHFVAADHFFLGRDGHYVDEEDYEGQVYRMIATDLREAMVPGGDSPVKAAFETLRALRDTLRMAVEFKGLTLASHLDFVNELRGRFARLIAGPPVFRSQQLRALIDAGVVKVPFGPSPELLPAADGRVLLRSTHLQRQFRLVVDEVVRAHLDSPSLPGSVSPLLTNLARRGRLRPLSFDGVPAGGLDLTEDFHPLSVAGEAEERLWVFGAVSEGARYFTYYILSPKSRVRAFLDAKKCASLIVGNSDNLAPGRQTAVLLDLRETSGPGATTRSGASGAALKEPPPTGPSQPATLG
ncbi:MAG TPA: FAD/NAD(P)-binding protein [Acidimicrobiales bacterium]|nr:FAD/NAD(P)-binding protein [Acidimicrobiales bacterium]